MHPETRAETYWPASSESPAWRRIVYGTQFLAYPLLLGLRLLVVRNKLQRHPGLTKAARDKDRAFVIYANHQSKLDPFIICASLPFQAVVAMLPFRFFIENSYLKGPGSKLFLSLFGGFPAHFHPAKPYGLDHAKHSLKSNQSVVIFPQGERTQKRVAKPGIAMLANEPGVSLIPIKIDWKNRLHCEVKIGEVFSVNEFKGADSLMDKVHQLNLV